MGLPRFVVVMGRCDGLVSIGRYMWAHLVEGWSAFSDGFGPVCLLLVWCCRGSLILPMEGVEAL